MTVWERYCLKMFNSGHTHANEQTDRPFHSVNKDPGTGKSV